MNSHDELFVMNYRRLGILYNKFRPNLNRSGFVAFKSVLDAIKCHHKSGLHFRAEFALNSAQNIHNSAIAIHMDAEQEFSANRAGHKSIFESIMFCGHQGIPMRGYRDENVTANFNCLLTLIGKFNPDVEKYLGSENKVKFLSPQIENEVLKDLAHTLLRGLFDRIRAKLIGVNKKESVFSIILDETSDINRNEQVSVCVRFCNTEMNSEEVFLGFHMTKRTTADALLSLIKGSLTAFNLPFSRVRGQG